MKGILVCALAVVVGACGHGPAVNTERTLHSVRVAAVEERALSEAIHAVGFLTPKDETRLSFKLGGYIESIPVEEGRSVRAGELLATLKQTEVNASLDQAREAAAKARRDLKRGKSLLADGVAAEEQVQDLNTAYQVASAAAAGAEFNAAHARIFAPTDGVILRKLAQNNELVQAGQPVVTMGSSLRGWIVRVGLADRDAVRMRLNDAASVEFDAWPGKVFTGQVSNISSAADVSTGTFTVEVRVETAAARFVQGLVGKVTLKPTEGAVGKIVPIQALIEASDDRASVFVFDPATRRVRRAAVRLGRMNETQIEVREGVQTGAFIVTDGAAFLDDGETVRIEHP